MFEQTFKNINNILYKDTGCSSELGYVEQTSLILFLKYLDDFEKDKKTAAPLAGKIYVGIISLEYRWDLWATPKGTDGKLFGYLKKNKTFADSANTIKYKIGEIFSKLKNKIQCGYNMREVINRIDELRFLSCVEKHDMSPSTKPKSRIWATQAEMTANTAHSVRLSKQSERLYE